MTRLWERKRTRLSALGLAAGLLLLTCEDFQVTDHTFMTGDQPPEYISIPARNLSESEMIGHWRFAMTVGDWRSPWPEVGCVVEHGSSGRFLATEINTSMCGGPGLTSFSGTWSVEGPRLVWRYYLDADTPRTLPMDLRLVRTGTYCLVGVDGHGFGREGTPADPDTATELQCIAILQRAG